MTDMTNRIYALQIAIIAMVSLLAVQPAAMAAEKNAGQAMEIMEGKITGIEGVVEVLKMGAKEWVQAKEGMTVLPGDAVSVGIDGTAKLAYENSATDIEPLAQFVIGRAIETEDQYTTEIFLQVGEITVDVDHIGEKINKFNIVTPSSVLELHGTVVEVGYTSELGTEVTTYEGEATREPLNQEELPPAIQIALGVGPATAEPPEDVDIVAYTDEATDVDLEAATESVEQIEAPEEAQQEEDAVTVVEAPAAQEEVLVAIAEAPAEEESNNSGGDGNSGESGGDGNSGESGGDGNSGESGGDGNSGESGGEDVATPEGVDNDGDGYFYNSIDPSASESLGQYETMADDQDATVHHNHLDPSNHAFGTDHDQDGYEFSPDDPNAIALENDPETLLNDQDPTVH